MYLRIYIIFHCIACVFPLLIVSLGNRTSRIMQFIFFPHGQCYCVSLRNHSHPKAKKIFFKIFWSFIVVHFIFVSQPLWNWFLCMEGGGDQVSFLSSCFSSRGTPGDAASAFCDNSAVLLLSFSYSSALLLLPEIRQLIQAEVCFWTLHLSICYHTLLIFVSLT